MSLARFYSATLLLSLLTGVAGSHAAEPAPRPKARSFSDDDLKKYVHLRTKSTPLPDSADAISSSAAAGPLKVITPQQLADDAARKPYVRKPPVQADSPAAHVGRKDESKAGTSAPAGTDN
jgi:hypothetical protein